MTIRQLKRLCLIAGTVLLLACPLVLAWALVWPCRLPQSNDSSRSAIASASDRSGATVPPVPPQQAFEELYELPLRRPLYDPPPVVVKTPPKPKPPRLEFTLVGTTIEPGRTTAMLSSPKGGLQFKKVGETLKNANLPVEIVEIAEGRVVVRYADQLITLTLEGAGG